MVYDATFYQVLAPIALSLRLFTFGMLPIAFFSLKAQASVAGMAGQAEKARKLAIAAYVSPLIFIVFFWPTATPGLVFPMPTEDITAQTQYGKATPATFVLERLSYALDSTLVEVLAFDITISGQEAIREEKGMSNADISFNFLKLRGQFICKYVKTLWETGEEGRDEDTSFWGFLSSLGNLELMEFISKKIAALIYGLGSTLLLAIAYILVLLLGMVLIGLAFAARLALPMIMLLFMAVLPISYTLHGFKALIAGLKVMVSFLFMKFAVVLVIWGSFFLLEGIILNGYQMTLAPDSPLNAMVEQFEPGFLYTEAGSDMIFGLEQAHRLGKSSQSLSFTLISIIGMLFMLVWLVFKIPALISTFFGTTNPLDDALGSITILAAGSAQIFKNVGAAVKGGGKNSVKGA